MNNIIERIEKSTNKSIMALIYLALRSSLLAASWNNYYIKRGAAPIDANFHQKLREVSMAKLISFGVKPERLQEWYDVFDARFESFGIFRDQIISQIVDGTIPEERMNRLFAKNTDVFNDEINRIADEYSYVDCVLAREQGYDSCLPLYHGDQLVVRRNHLGENW